MPSIRHTNLLSILATISRIRYYSATDLYPIELLPVEPEVNI